MFAGGIAFLVELVTMCDYGHASKIVAKIQDVFLNVHMLTET